MNYLKTGSVYIYGTNTEQTKEVVLIYSGFQLEGLPYFYFEDKKSGVVIGKSTLSKLTLKN
jgi:hypothetical protein